MEHIIFLGLKVAVFAYVMSLQVKNFKDSRRAAQKIHEVLNQFDSSELPGLETAMGRLDRLVEPSLDDIRRFSNAALVTGIGGTMGLFLVEILSLGIFQIVLDQDLSELGRWNALIGIILAVFASLIGIISHLRILSKILHDVQVEVDRKWDALIQEPASGQQLAIDWKEPEVNFIEAVQKFLEEQRIVISEMQKRFREDLSVAKQVLDTQKELKNVQSGISDSLKDLSDAARSIKNSVDDVAGFTKPLHKNAEELNGLPERMKTIMVEAFGAWDERIKDRQDSFTQQLQGIFSDIAGPLHKSTEQLNGLPERMEAIMVEAFGAWEERIKDGQDSFTQQLQGILSDVKGTSDVQKHSTEEIHKRCEELSGLVDKFLTELRGSLKSQTENLESLPDKLEHSIKEFDRIFGDEAKIHVRELRDVLEGGLERLTNRVVENQDKAIRRISDQSEQIIESIYKGLKRDFDAQIINPLERLMRSLDATSEEMPHAAADFGKKLQESVDTLLKSLGATSEEMLHAAADFGKKLRESVDTLSEIPEKLETATESITQTLQCTTIEVMSPVSSQMEAFMKTMEDTHICLDKSVKELLHLIEQLLVEIEGRK